MMTVVTVDPSEPPSLLEVDRSGKLVGEVVGSPLGAMLKGGGVGAPPPAIVGVEVKIAGDSVGLNVSSMAVGCVVDGESEQSGVEGASVGGCVKGSAAQSPLMQLLTLHSPIPSPDWA